MKLYYVKDVCSLATRIIIHEIGIPCKYESVNLRTKKTETGSDFLTINPKGAVPALELDDGEILTENAIILQYLSDKYEATHLLPAHGDFRRYRVLEWLNFIGTDLHKICMPLFSSKVPDETKKNFFVPILEKKLLFVDDHLQHHSFLMGDHIALPDPYLFVVLRWLKGSSTSLSDSKNLSRYFSEMNQQQSVQRAMQEENLLR